MNFFQSMAMAALISGLVAGTALADATSTPPATPDSATGTNTTSSPGTFHIGETYEEHLQNEMNKNAALAQQQQQQQGKQEPQRIGKPVEIDGVKQ